MSQDKFHQLVNSVAKAVEGNQKIATPFLASKLAKYADAYPHDQTIGSMSRIIEKMVDNNTLFIRKSELKSLYQKLYSRGTQFSDFFEEELGEVSAEPTVTTYQRDESVNLPSYQVGDQILANALESVFDHTIPLKLYSQPLANKALKSVSTTLEAWNLHPNKLTIGNGNDKFIVIKADYETPKGITSFYVPVEVNKTDVIEPEVFMGNAGPQDLNNVTVKAYLTQHAGNKLKVDASSILNVITKAASENREVSDVELAVIRLNASRQGTSEFFQNQIVGLKVAEAGAKDVELPKLKEFESFETQFTSPQGLASWEFGDEKINLARNHIARELVSFGFSKPQITISSSNKDTIFYSVSLNSGKVAFTVPVKIANDKLIRPTVMLCNGSISSFDQDGINELVSNDQTDNKAAAVASNFSTLKPSELINNLREAMSEGNHAKAEDALNVLANAGDDKAYATAFSIYMGSLSGIKIASTQCSRIIKNAVSEYPICSHTGLPVNKVYQDKDGHCRPMYRKGMDETYEGASFMNAKVFG